MASLGSAKVPGPIEFISGNKGSWIRVYTTCSDGSWSGMAISRRSVIQCENKTAIVLQIVDPFHLMGGVSLHIVAQGSGH
ncbi:hypothetical protein GE21DRAFT_236 [Neurospora crassa]|uniref:Uncharacterized protein n=1 Tax=Neurospora crassa (strain ATCC 24698 / 74-OR23-1A / CBS 708.71 / DSM 1257 / FGSC 987) TaxID=367110 RepID=Q7SE01_NEUCR|nr:hypothetical protein NCU02183 [Neurospora crassa OR74A]EAA35017.1 hypothetical protein NCU02183 [Neurospora crassa OR74A]KHE81325.1 hypothetical protein GE21DRAFT_236 [Neurospora crassa]|eukprot:XP_964253.1 hypothetical protein NCU02183 [Neurospora crassa OR74A]